MRLLLDDPMWTECAASQTLPPDISPRRLISRLEGRMIQVAKDAIQAIMQSSRR